MTTQTQSRSFKSLAEFALSLRRAAETHSPDPRLIYAAAPSTQSQESDGGSGGYLVPADVRAEVTQALLSETSLLGRTDHITTIKNSVTLPADASPVWATMQPTVEPEGALLAQSKLKLESRTVRLVRIQATVPCSDELLADGGGALTSYLRRGIADRFDFKITDLLINGTGTSGVLGILNSPATIVQAAEGGQAAATVLYSNLVKAWGRLWSPAKSRAIWLIHSSVEQQLMTMVTGAASSVWPAGMFVYNQDSSAQATLFGRPVIVTDACQPLGTPGDVILCDPLSILTVTREGGVREDLSLHAWFDLDLAAFRFALRIGGLPWWAAPVTPYRGGNTVSSAVVLATR